MEVMLGGRQYGPVHRVHLLNHIPAGYPDVRTIELDVSRILAGRDSPLIASIIRVNTSDLMGIQLCHSSVSSVGPDCLVFRFKLNGLGDVPISRSDAIQSILPDDPDRATVKSRLDRLAK